MFMIWYADLDLPDASPTRTCVTPSKNVITADDVSTIQGQVASPAELKKQLDDVKIDLEKKFHAAEQTKLFNRALIMSLIGGFLTLIFTVFIKPYFEGSKEGSQPSAAAQAADKPPAGGAVKPEDKDKVIVLPAH